MLAKLKIVIRKEMGAVEKQLELLDKQNSLIMKNDAIKLEMVVEEIKVANRDIAEFEVEKRKLLNGQNFKEVIFQSGDAELENLFREMRKKVDLLRLQNETNSMLIKQQLSYTNRMLMILNPNREAKIYNSYGNMKR
ncbi:flagellar protein FlgN [uncultured Clostridium sp.]|uniref:flagellar protein FlgN n=1 Tax=uncultured Clostridium sp. TaxID=59620 RepID=UPI00263733E8|nr:flagellar protein FlgN [uncultured Clostridium sp.]